MEKEPTFLTVGQAADQLGVSTETVANWLDKGYLNGYRLPSGYRRIEEASVKAMVAERKREMSQRRGGVSK